MNATVLGVTANIAQQGLHSNESETRVPQNSQTLHRPIEDFAVEVKASDSKLVKVEVLGLYPINLGGIQNNHTSFF